MLLSAVSEGLEAAELALTPEQRVEVLNEAIRAYDRGTAVLRTRPDEARAAFREAAEKFELLVASGVRNGRLYYNLGNACLQAGQLGRALVNYRRAARLVPGDPRVQHNLEYARSLRRNQIESAGQRAFWKTLLFWHYQTSLTGRYRLALVAYMLFWLFMLAGVFRPRPYWKYPCLTLLAIWLVVGASAAVQILGRPAYEGVITTDDVIVRKGNGDGFEPQFQQRLHEGVEFIVIEQRPGWWYIELPDGNTGWIRTDQAELI